MKKIILFLYLYCIKVFCEPDGEKSSYGNYDIKNNNTVCSMEILIDSLLWRHIREKFPGHDLPDKKVEVDQKARRKIYNLIEDHVAVANNIFRSTKWGVNLTIQFQIQRIAVNFDDCFSSYDGKEKDPLCAEDIGIDDYLKTYSLRNHNGYCVSYVFTYRDFKGVLGKAYSTERDGSPSSGCVRYWYYNLGDLTTNYTKRSLNVGVVTFLNDNSEISSNVSKLVFTRELGRSFGAEVSVKPCKEGEEGIDLLSPLATIDHQQNQFFSPCSIKNITFVLYNLQLNRKGNCLLPPSESFCGNNIVESGEECDCGLNNTECTDTCCYPREVSLDDRKRNATAKGCTRRANAQCSPSEGPCCDVRTCQYVSEGRKELCLKSTECSYESFCSGLSAKCPEPEHLANLTKCNEGSQVCLGGQCRGSLCLTWNMKECSLSTTDRRVKCQLACQAESDPGTCQNTADLAKRIGLPVGGISLRPGAHCDNYRGQCDEYLNCQPLKPQQKNNSTSLASGLLGMSLLSLLFSFVL